jgi:hypothetical protein
VRTCMTERLLNMLLSSLSPKPERCLCIVHPDPKLAALLTNT